MSPACASSARHSGSSVSVVVDSAGLAGAVVIGIASRGWLAFRPFLLQHTRPREATHSRRPTMNVLPTTPTQRQLGLGLLVLRLALGAVFLVHGGQKLFQMGPGGT